ncbi:MAG: SDR family NAD(P)-dependent oxidoreductase [Spirochaetaceae bacterium]|jgi:short-subunit dehydrogenase|nr:SDR family NAD(P)-dependent oxidoreductase [Spirochaetaceae bacterium]
MHDFALVTGASSGIGLAISGELARRGYPLLMVSNEEAKLAEAAASLQAEYHVKTIALYMDLAQKDSAHKLFNYSETNNLKIGIVVNNAGIYFFKDVTNTPPERIETVINLHILTPALLCRLFAQQMISEGRRGYILNIASIAARMMMLGIALYSSTKSFLRCFSRSMRLETFDHGVSITTISPGAAATGLYNMSPRYVKLGVRFGYIITPERLASLAVKKMFQRKAEYIPDGFINRLFILLVAAIPEALVRRIKKKMDTPH